MFREMRRIKSILTPEENVEILNRATAGVLALSGDDDYPYALPMSYVYDNNKIYFHCALIGHKLDAIKKNNKVSFCIIDKDEIVPEKYTTYYKSVIVFGKARILTDETEKRYALEKLAERYSPKQVEGRQKEIEGSFDRVCMVEIAIDHISGKQAKELVQKKQNIENKQ